MRLDDMNFQDASVPSVWTRAPRIRALSTTQAQYILARNHVGRLAFVSHGLPELLPLHYVYRNGRVYARTSFGPRCAEWVDNPFVTFGVDEASGLFDWRSILVRGTLRILSPRGTHDERSAYWRAVAAIRTLLPDALTERDPVAERRVVIMIEPGEITGREASTHFLPGSLTADS